jgi:hypothetical protein
MMDKTYTLKMSETQKRATQVALADRRDALKDEIISQVRYGPAGEAKRLAQLLADTSSALDLLTWAIGEKLPEKTSE